MMPLYLSLVLTSIILQIFIQYLMFVSLYYQMYLAQPHWKAYFYSIFAILLQVTISFKIKRYYIN